MVQKIFGNSGKSEKKEIPRKVLPFFPKIFHRDEPFHLKSPRSYRKFHSNGKRSQSLRSRYLDRHANTSRQWLYVDGTVTKCPFTGGVLVGVGLFGKI